ncbi:MAG: DUF3095 domain-containing protein [Gammaproteobacteria bacterium]|nr:DUF3095 domain-containing protein [Gammaproteobacteria bacterium]
MRELAEERFNLSLRVGGVAVAKIHQHSSARVRVGKHRLSPGNEIAAFSGEGIELAESRIKSDSHFRYQQSFDGNDPGLSGLAVLRRQACDQPRELQA